MKKVNIRKSLRYLVPEIKLALIKEPGRAQVSIHVPDDIEPLVQPLRYLPEEHFVAFHLSSGNQVIGYNVVSHGTVTASLVHPREVFKAAILSNATSIIVAHNHPGDSPFPSPEDVATTEVLVKAGKLLSIPVLDHIIVTNNGIVSIRDRQPSLFR